MMKLEEFMRSPKELTRAEIVRAADNFRWTRKGAKWTVIVGERELPARPLVLEARVFLRMTDELAPGGGDIAEAGI